MAAPEQTREEADGFTVDAFHRGDFHLVQPARRGHRAGTDAMMLAAAVPGNFRGRLADLGAGAGAAGLAVASRCPGVDVVLIENAPEMADFARRSLALPENAGLASRGFVLEADVQLAEGDRRKAGLADFSFDWAIMNPPFNRPGDRASPDALRRYAHVMDNHNVFESWLRTAGWIVKPGGGVAVIARPESLQPILSGMHAYFGAQEVKSLHPRSDRAATRVVVRAIRGSNRPLSMLPPLFLHAEGSDRFTAEADAINNGRASLFGD
ncbi:MAG: methyltransferase [Mesorhizobium sp.]|nr:methyltransferase [Mesorhizobium sp.]MBL8577385.1 methyltransferase [Mesorhizobium sp.]